MLFDQYVVEAANYRRANPAQRLGQSYFNLLYYVRPDISEAVRGSALDPFYNDTLVGEFLAFVASEW